MADAPVTLRTVLKAHVEKLEAGRADPAAPLRAQVAGLQARLERLTADEKDLKVRLDADLARSTKLREAEMAQANACSRPPDPTSRIRTLGPLARLTAASSI